MAALLGGSAQAAVHHVKTPVHLHISRHQIPVGGTIILRASLAPRHGAARILFRVRRGSGRWIAVRRPRASSMAAIRLSRGGTYWVQAVAMRTVHRQGKPAVEARAASQPQVVYVGASASLTVATPSLAAGTAATFSAKAANVADAQYRVQYRPMGGRWSAPLGFGVSHDHVQVRLANPGPYQARVEVRTPGGIPIASPAVSFRVYGSPSAIELMPSRKVWVADGAEQETLTARVVDAKGDVVSNYQGAGTLSDPHAAGAISSWGGAAANLTQIQSHASVPLQFVNGQASVVLQAGFAQASDVLTAASTISASQVVTGSITISAAAQVPSSIGLQALSPYLIANESGNPANYTVAVDDQAGEPMLSGTYALTGAIVGPAQFHDLTAGPDTLTYQGGQGPAPITLYSVAGATGPVALTVSYPGLSSALVTVPALLGGQPYQMGVSAQNTTLKAGQSTTLTLTQLTKAGGVCDPASLDNSGYVVSITTAQGNPASGFSLGGIPYVGQSLSFAVAAGPNFFYAVSQPVPLTVTSAPPGTYDIVVADADGLWKSSAPLVLTVT